MSALIELAERCEAAGADEQRELLVDAFRLRYPLPSAEDEPEWQGPGTLREPLYHHWRVRRNRFDEMLDAEAYESAALTLVPEGWFVYGMGEGVTPIIRRGDTHKRMDFWAEVQREQGGFLRKARAQTLSLALTAAALRARASMEVE